MRAQAYNEEVICTKVEKFKLMGKGVGERWEGLINGKDWKKFFLILILQTARKNLFFYYIFLNKRFSHQKI